MSIPAWVASHRAAFAVACGVAVFAAFQPVVFLWPHAPFWRPLDACSPLILGFVLGQCYERDRHRKQAHVTTEGTRA